MENNTNGAHAEKKTGAKRIGKTIAAIIIAGGLVVGGITGANYLINGKENQRVKNLVAEYTNESFLMLPNEVTINQAYDISYCDGKKLYNEITKSNIKYCQVLDEYYTEDGHDIVVLTINGYYEERVPAIETKIGDTSIYMAPDGYQLDGKEAFKKINATYTKVIEPKDNVDYSKITVEGLSDVQIDYQICHTKPFSEMMDKELIVDVPDNATLVNEQCEGSLRLVSRR